MLKILGAKIINDNKKSSNIVSDLLVLFEVYLQCLTRVVIVLLQFPVALLEERDKRAQWQEIPVLLRRLHESSHPNSDFSKIHSMVMVFKTSLCSHKMHHLKYICIICYQMLSELFVLCRNCHHCCLWRLCHLSQRSAKHHRSRFLQIHIRLTCLEELM